MKSIVVDFEFCNVNRKQRELAGTGLYHEIIEFGAVMLDQDRNVIGRFGRFVKPQFGSITSEIVRLTGITEKMLENEEDFKTVLEAFIQWIGNNEFEICSWSMSDYHQLSSEINEKTPGCHLNLLSNWRDVQREFGDGLSYKGMVSLKNAMSSIDEDFAGKAHDALADAENTASLFLLLSDKEQFDRRTKPLQELFQPVESTGNTLGYMFADLFAQFA